MKLYAEKPTTRSSQNDYDPWYNKQLKNNVKTSKEKDKKGGEDTQKDSHTAKSEGTQTIARKHSDQRKQQKKEQDLKRPDLEGYTITEETFTEQLSGKGDQYSAKLNLYVKHGKTFYSYTRNIHRNQPLSIPAIIALFQNVSHEKASRLAAYDPSLYAEAIQWMSSSSKSFYGDRDYPDGGGCGLSIEYTKGDIATFDPLQPGIVTSQGSELGQGLGSFEKLGPRVQALNSYYSLVPTPDEMLNRSETGGWESFWKEASPWVHGALDILGLVPVLGEVADGINTVIYGAEGDYVNSALSAAAMIPFAGWFATGTKAGIKGGTALASKLAQKSPKIVQEVAQKVLGRKTGKITRKQIEKIIEDSSQKLFMEVAEEGGFKVLKKATNKAKGQFGEIITDLHMKSKGYIKLGGQKGAGKGARVTKGPHGIDGVYFNPKTNKYVVGESKFSYDATGVSLGMTKKGRQMSKDWIEDKLKKAVGQKKARDIIEKGYERIIFMVDKYGKVVEKVLP